MEQRNLISIENIIDHTTVNFMKHLNLNIANLSNHENMCPQIKVI
jgi:hypothetical protein